MFGAFSKEVVGAYGGAAEALGRAAERVSVSRNQTALLARVRLLEIEALGVLENDPIYDTDLASQRGDPVTVWRRLPHNFARVFAKQLPLSPTAADILEWLRDATNPGDSSAHKHPLEANESRLTAWERHAGVAIGKLPPLLAAGEVSAAFGRLSPLSRGNLVLSTMLGDRLVAASKTYSNGGIAAIGIMRRQIPWRGLVAASGGHNGDDPQNEFSLEQRGLNWLEALTAGGEAVIQLAQRVDRWWEFVREACTAKRTTSRLVQVAEIAANYPSIGASQLAKAMGISRQGATLLLEEARALQLVREVTHGRSFRRYAAAL